MTTQAEDLVKALDKHSASVVAASIHIHTGLSQIATALGYQTPSQTGQVAPGRPRMPGRVERAAEPLRGAQDATQPLNAQHPDWADALVVTDGVGVWGKVKDKFVRLASGFGGGALASVDDFATLTGPITVVLDGDGNPPHPQACAERVAELQEQLHAVARERDEALSSTEQVWLDADELGQLPLGSVVIPRSENVPRVNHYGGWFRTPGGIGAISRDIAPARVLWTPEENR